MTGLKLATSRYRATHAVIASKLAPVAITVGRPRFRLGFDLAAHFRRLAPHPNDLRAARAGDLSDDEFEARYRARLNAIGVTEIRRLLADVAERQGAPGCALLCFEDVHRGEVCHRRMLADWWFERTAEEIPEL